MKHHQLLIVLVFAILLTGCKLMWPITINNNDFSKVEGVKVNSLVLKSGKRIKFGKDGGKYIKTIIKDTIYTGIIGFDTLETNAMNFPMNDIVTIEGRRGEFSIANTILVIVLGAMVLSLGIFLYLLRTG